MKSTIQIDCATYGVDFSAGTSIAIQLKPNDLQPNHFGAEDCKSQPLVDGTFIGDTLQGGSCNVNTLTITPHCNGTHTESISHIANQLFPVHQAIKRSLFPCVVISIEPVNAYKSSDSYIPNFDDDNLVITRQQLESVLKQYSNTHLHGLVIRTLPNSSEKQNAVYSSKNYPPYLTNDAMHYLCEREVTHLMVDFPSVDKMYDDGQLSNHRIFWQVNLGSHLIDDNSKPFKTITEMVFVESSVKDDLYLCQLSVPAINTDAVPSQPILYSLVQQQ